MKYIPDAECFKAANEASGGALNKDDINEAFQRINDYKEELQRSGNISGMDDRLRRFAEREGERAKLAAAMRRRHAALNILIRDRQMQAIDSMMQSGLSPRQAMLAIMEGTSRGIEGGRNSVAALNLAYEARYAGALFAELEATSPHLVHALRGQALDADITREMMQLRPGGRPGITGNADALKVARIYAGMAELARKDLNALGANIGRLDGWAGVQAHDDVKMIAAGKDAWVAFVKPRLDLARTFPNMTASQADDALRGLYDEFIAGFPVKEDELGAASYVAPANLARKLGESRVLHFKDAEAALDYRGKFGYGNTTSGILHYLRRAARSAALMESLGPNPEAMFRSISDALKRRVANDPSIAPERKGRLSNQLNVEAGALRDAIDVATGAYARPANVTAARIAADIRAVEGMAKLGGSTISSIADIPTVALASQFRGSGFLRGLMTQIEGLMRGRPKGEQAEIAYLLGEGFDGLIGHIVAPAAVVDGPVGKLSRLQEGYFKWNGLTWWTDVNRAVAARTISAEMGMRIGTAYADLPDAYRHVLGLHGIDAAKWAAIQKAGYRVSEGRQYVTPDRIRSLDDDTIAALASDRLTAATEEGGDAASRRAEILADTRRDLELSLLRFFADETDYGMIEPDAGSRRFMFRGTRPGTFAGELLRFIGQFKSFPVAFTQRVGGRALYGFRKDASWLDRTQHIGTLLTGLTIAGYMSMTAKDLLRGYWPPRDPTKAETWAAAFAQGGAFGIYGDYLFGQANRFGNSVLETAAGPSIGTASDIINLWLKARDAAMNKLTGEDARAPAAQALTLVVNNTPFANLAYVRPALDYLFLNTMREMFSPGYLKRQAHNRVRDYGQTRYLPVTIWR